MSMMQLLLGVEPLKQTIHCIQPGFLMENIRFVLFSKTGQLDFNQQIFKDTASEIWIYTENEKLKQIKVLLK